MDNNTDNIIKQNIIIQNIDEIIEQGKKMRKLSEYTDVSLKNLTWEINLPLYEQFMLRDDKRSFMIKTSELNENDFNQYFEISKISKEIEEFYEEIGKGIHRDSSSFDASLTKEQAYEKYCHCDSETARKIVELITKVKEATTFHVKDVRENYKGDLSIQLGIEKEKYIAEEKEYHLKMLDLMDAAKEVINELESKVDTDKRIEAEKNFYDIVNKTAEEYGRMQAEKNYEDFANKTVEEYGRTL